MLSQVASNKVNQDAISQLLSLISDINRLINRQTVDTIGIMSKTVDELMGHVASINERTEFKVKKADELLVKGTGQQGFISVSAKDVDSSFKNSTEKFKFINESVVSQLDSLKDLDESVQKVLFSIMGALSTHDVVHQRIEHVILGAQLAIDSISRVVLQYGQGTLTHSILENEMKHIEDKLFRAFTMEEEKVVFRKAMGA
jgi:hypothetical protein